MGLEKRFLSSREHCCTWGLKISLDFQFMGQISDKWCCLSALSTSSNHPGYCLTPLYNNCSWYRIFSFYTHSCVHFVYMFCVLLCMGLYKPSIYLFFILPFKIAPRILQSFFPSWCQHCILSVRLFGQPRSPHGFTGTKSILLNFKNVCVYLNIHIIY